MDLIRVSNQLPVNIKYSIDTSKLDLAIYKLCKDPDKARVFNEWFARSSRYQNANMWLYIGCDTQHNYCKCGISIEPREPVVRLWDDACRCIYGVLLPNEIARRFESYITAKYRDSKNSKVTNENSRKYIFDNETSFRNGYREVYPFKLWKYIYKELIELIPQNAIMRTARTNSGVELRR